jgi:MFS family permease
MQGTVFSFGGPARQAFIPELVGEKQLMNAIALNSAGMNLTRIVGPSIAGGLAAITWIDIQGVFYVQASLNLLSVVLLFAILPVVRTRSEAQPVAAAAEAATGATSPQRRRGSVRGEMLDGLRYIAASPILLTLLMMGLVPSLLGLAYQTFLPVFAKDVFGDGIDRNSQGLGLMMTMTGVGALAGSLAVASMSDYPRRTKMQLIAGVGFGLSLAFFTLQSSFVLALAGLTCLGFAANFFQALNSTMVMSSSDSRYYGRVMSVNMMTFALMPLGTLPIGFLADLIGTVSIGSLDLQGIQVALLGSGLIITLFILAVAIRNPAYRKLEQDDLRQFAVVAAERVDGDAEGSAWSRLRAASRQRRGIS